MLLMLGCTFIITSAFASDGQTQPGAKSGKIVNISAIKKVFTDGTLIGSNGLASTIYIAATNTSTSQTYYLTVYSAFPSNSSDHTFIPEGTYNISITASEYAGHILCSDDDDYVPTSGYYYLFTGITVNSSYDTVIDVQY